MQTKISLDTNNGDSRRNRSTPVKVINSLGNFISLLSQRDLEPDLRNEIIKVARSYPEGSLNYLYNNIESTIVKCQNRLSLMNQVPQQSPTAVETSMPTPQPTIKASAKPIIEQRKSLFDEPPIIPEKPSKWTTVSASEVNKIMRKSEPKPPPAPVKQPTPTNQPTWTPSDDPELEEYRRKADEFAKGINYGL